MRGKIPIGRKVITSRWVLKKKFKADSSTARRKARLVARGFEQVASLDYFATFASVIRYATLRILLVKVAAKDLEADHVDINTAFLNPDLEEEIYIAVPRFLEEIFPKLASATDAYLKLNKALYRLKQAPKAWFLIVKKFFTELGMQSLDADPNLFIGQGVYILLFVDDMLICGKRLQVDVVKAMIQE
jgi:hypothetical protein